MYVASFEATQEHNCKGQKMDPYKWHKWQSPIVTFHKATKEVATMKMSKSEV